jgi:hypothetical protein
VESAIDQCRLKRTRSTKHAEIAAGMLHANANNCLSMGTSITKLVHPSISTVYASSEMQAYWRSSNIETLENIDCYLERV